MLVIVDPVHQDDAPDRYPPGPGHRARLYCMEEDDPGCIGLVVSEHGHSYYPARAGCLPDLDDPATRGLLPFLGREALGAPNAYVLPLLDGWMGCGPTEEAAWVAALEGAR